MLNIAVLVFSLAVALTQAKLHRFALQYTGACVPEQTPGSMTCDAKAVSQTFYSYIDNKEGVDFGVRQQMMGPVSLFHAKQAKVNGQMKVQGSATFGTYRNTHTTVSFEFDQTDYTQIVDPNSENDYLSIGYAKVTNATGTWAGATGYLTFNTLGKTAQADEPQVDMTILLVGNLLLPN